MGNCEACKECKVGRNRKTRKKQTKGARNNGATADDAAIYRPKGTLWSRAKAVWGVVGALVSIVAVAQFLVGPCQERARRQALIADFQMFDTAWYPNLIRQYPGGYILWMRDHQSIVGGALTRDVAALDVSTDGAGPTSVSGDTVTMRLPKIVEPSCRDTLYANTLITKREKGRRFVGQLCRYTMWLDVLNPDPERLVTIVGFVPLPEGSDAEGR